LVSGKYSYAYVYYSCTQGTTFYLLTAILSCIWAMLMLNISSFHITCFLIINCLIFADGVSDLSVTGNSSKNILSTQPSALADTLPLPPQPALIMPPKPTFNLTKPSTSIMENQIDALKSDRMPEPKPKPTPLATESELGLPPPKEEDGGFRNLETLVQFKEAEAKLFQRLADDARKEVDGYSLIVKAKAEKLEEEYAAKVAKLHLQEAEERRRKKLEEIKFLENSHCDYQNMKVRMQAEIASLLQRMEATKKQWA